MEDIQIEHCRDSVKEFAIAMEHKLRANDFKGGWKDSTSTSLLIAMIEETKELTESMLTIHQFSSPDILSECTDVANFAMMIYDNTKPA